MKGQATLFSSARNTWRTPAAMAVELAREFGKLHDVSLRQNGDAFTYTWPRRWYANPPYGPDIRAWVERASLWAKLERASGVGVMLLPARTDTRWYHDTVLPTASEIRFVRGRLHRSEEHT